MPTYPNTNALHAAIIAEVARLHGDLDAAAVLATSDMNAPSAGEGRRRIPASADTPTGAAKGASPAAQDIVAAIDERIGRLEQVRDWIDEDDELARLIDSTMQRRIRESERRQNRRNTALNVVFLIAGWLLSLVGTPAALAGLLGR